MNLEALADLNEKANYLLNRYKKDSKNWPKQLEELCSSATDAQFADGESIAHFIAIGSIGINEYDGDPVKFNSLSLNEKLAVLSRLVYR